MAVARILVTLVDGLVVDRDVDVVAIGVECFFVMFWIISTGNLVVLTPRSPQGEVILVSLFVKTILSEFTFSVIVVVKSFLVDEDGILVFCWIGSLFSCVAHRKIGFTNPINLIVVLPTASKGLAWKVPAFVSSALTEIANNDMFECRNSISANVRLMFMASWNFCTHTFGDFDKSTSSKERLSGGISTRIIPVLSLFSVLLFSNVFIFDVVWLSLTFNSVCWVPIGVVQLVAGFKFDSLTNSIFRESVTDVSLRGTKYAFEFDKVL